VVDETEKGWYVQYIDRDPETITMQEALVRKEKMDRDNQKMMMKFIEKQIEKRKYSNNGPRVFTEFVRPNEELKVVLNLKLETRRDEDIKNKTWVTSNPLKSDCNRGDTSSAGNKKVSKNPSN
jgi:DNA/RNA-binding protein KIN17